MALMGEIKRGTRVVVMDYRHDFGTDDLFGKVAGVFGPFITVELDQDATLGGGQSIRGLGIRSLDVSREQVRYAERTFTPNETHERDVWVTQAIENDCEGCREQPLSDGYSQWRPVEDCPVHGVNAESWWDMINDRLDERWPGVWS